MNIRQQGILIFFTNERTKPGKETVVNLSRLVKVEPLDCRTVVATVKRKSDDKPVEVLIYCENEENRERVLRTLKSRLRIRRGKMMFKVILGTANWGDMREVPVLEDNIHTCYLKAGQRYKKDDEVILEIYDNDGKQLFHFDTGFTS